MYRIIQKIENNTEEPLKNSKTDKIIISTFGNHYKDVTAEKNWLISIDGKISYNDNGVLTEVDNNRYKVIDVTKDGVIKFASENLLFYNVEFYSFDEVLNTAEIALHCDRMDLVIDSTYLLLNQRNYFTNNTEEAFTVRVWVVAHKKAVTKGKPSNTMSMQQFMINLTKDGD